MRLRITQAVRIGGPNCRHIRMTTDLSGEVVEIDDILEELRQNFREYPGGYRGLLVALYAAFCDEQDIPLDRLPSKVKIEV